MPDRPPWLREPNMEHAICEGVTCECCPIFFMPAVHLPNQKDRLLAVFCVMSRRSGEARQQTTPVALGNEETVSQRAVLQLQPEPVVACEGCALALLQQ